MLHSKSAVLSDSKKHSPKVSVSKPRYSWKIANLALNDNQVKIIISYIQLN
jgi:hypothetical protein